MVLFNPFSLFFIFHKNALSSPSSTASFRCFFWLPVTAVPLFYPHPLFLHIFFTTTSSATPLHSTHTSHPPQMPPYPCPFPSLHMPMGASPLPPPPPNACPKSLPQAFLIFLEITPLGILALRLHAVVCKMKPAGEGEGN